MITGKQLADAAVAAIPMGITYKMQKCDKFVLESAKRAGKDLGRYAGSNDMFRRLKKMYPLDMAKKNGTLRPGAVLFIVEPGYNAKYDDYLGKADHVGIYTNDPKAEVMHSSETRDGVYPSTLKNAWTHAGWLDGVDYEDNDRPSPVPDDQNDYGGRGGDIVAEKTLFRVVLPEANKGQTVNMRKNPEPNSVVYEKIPDGTQLPAGEEFTRGGQRWREVRYNSMTGYIMAQYLAEVNSTDEAPYFPVAPDTIQPTGDLEYRVAQLEQWMKIVLDETGIGKRYGGM